MGKNYRISIGIDGLIVRTTPQYDRLIIQEDRPDGEVFLRPTLETTLVFMRYDYDYLATVALNKEIEVYIELDNGDGTYTLKYTGVFTKTDCEWDEDARICRVKPRTRDAYEKIMEGLNKEFNLVDLGAPLTPIQYDDNAVLQVYIAGSSFVQNYIEGNYFETPVTPYFSPNDLSNDLTNIYNFKWCGRIRHIVGNGLLNPDVSGVYDASFTSDNGNGRYQVRNSGSQWVIVDLDASASVVYTAPAGEDAFNLEAFQPGALFTSVSDPNSKCYFFIDILYARVLTNADAVQGVSTVDVSENDFTGQVSKGKKVAGVEINTFFASSGHTNSPTPWGKFSDDSLFFAGEYFNIPQLQGSAMFPLNKTSWEQYSVWFYFDAGIRNIFSDGRKVVTVNDAYRLHDVISAFLGELDPVLTHSNTADYSEFFYNDFSNPIRTKLIRPMIVPKSNILVGNYDQPTKKAPLRFGELLQFLKDFYKVYWYIRDGKFILEHIEYFERGGSYTTDQVGADLTTEIDPKTKLAWAYRTAKYTYDKSAMPERIEWNWMDPQSPVFEGYPIQMLAPQVEKGNVEVKSLSKFASDIDFIAVSPGEVSREGFVWIEAEQQGQAFYVPTVAVEFEGLTLNIQNGYASLTFAHGEYHTYQLPCEEVTINGATTTADSVIKTKVQEIQFPSDPVPSDIELVITTLGNGKPHSRTINLLTGMITTTLRHEQ